jgi:hypothetical protein
MQQLVLSVEYYSDVTFNRDRPRDQEKIRYCYLEHI